MVADMRWGLSRLLPVALAALACGTSSPPSYTREQRLSVFMSPPTDHFRAFQVKKERRKEGWSIRGSSRTLNACSMVWRLRGGMNTEAQEGGENTEERIARMEEEIGRLRRENADYKTATEVQRGTQKTLLDSWVKAKAVEPAGAPQGLPTHGEQGGAGQHAGGGEPQRSHDREQQEFLQQGGKMDEEDGLEGDEALLDDKTLGNVVRAVVHNVRAPPLRAPVRPVRNRAHPGRVPDRRPTRTLMRLSPPVSESPPAIGGRHHFPPGGSEVLDAASDAVMLTQKWRLRGVPRS